MSYYDILLAKQLSGGGGGGDITVESLSVTANGTYSAPSGKAYSPVVANVPNSYTASDEGKVVSSGALVAQTSQTIDTNGTYDTTLKNSVTVNVSGGGGGLEYEAGTWTPSADTEQCDITFTNTHSVPPSFVAVMGDINTLPSETTFAAFTYTNIGRIFGEPFHRTATKNYYGAVSRYYRNTGGQSGASDQHNFSNSDTSSASSSTYDSRYWCNENGICGKSGNGTDGVFKAGVTYNWVAIWYSIS